MVVINLRTCHLIIKGLKDIFVLFFFRFLSHHEKMFPFSEMLDILSQSTNVVYPFHVQLHVSNWIQNYLIYEQNKPTSPSWRRESLDNLEGSQPVAFTGWPVKSEYAKVGIFQRTRNVWLWHQADHATPTGLPHDGHCLLSPRPGNG